MNLQTLQRPEDLEDIEVVALDAWMTSVMSENREPVGFGQKIFVPDLPIDPDRHVPIPTDEFLRFSLTTRLTAPHCSPSQASRRFREQEARGFLQEACQQFGWELTDEKLGRFLDVLEREAMCVALFWDTIIALQAIRAKKGKKLKLILISNAWGFPAHQMVTESGFGAFFDEIVFSFEVGYQKPDPEIFLEACRRIGVRPEKVLMVGDSWENDLLGARRVGMPVVACDRLGRISEEQARAAGIPRIRNLIELLPLLGIPIPEEALRQQISPASVR